MQCNVLLTAIAFAAMSSTPLKTNLSWMAGTWTGNVWGGVMEEHWTTQSGDTLLGFNRVVKDGKTVHKEFIWIELADVTATLSVHVFREPAETVKYKLATHANHSATFENLSHKRLQRMTYLREKDEMLILLAGVRQDKPFEEKLRLKLAR